MTDYETWLEKVKDAVDGKNHRGISRWLAERLGLAITTVDPKLHRMLSGATVPRATFTAAVDAWLLAGAPDGGRKRAPNTTGYDGKAGGKARARKLSAARRKDIAKKARASRKA